MSISGNNNVLLGAGAALPTGVTSNAVVLGSAASTVYLGGAAVSASPTTLALAAGVRLQAGANPGVENQVLKSTGSSIQWANAAIAANSSYQSNPWNVQAGYTTYVVPSNATVTPTPTLTLPAANTTALIGVLLSVKNVSLVPLTISGTGLVAVNSRDVISSASIGSGGSCSLASDGTNWFMLDVTGPVPAAPGAPTSVVIATPESGHTPSSLTVSWSAPLSGTVTSYQVNVTQGGVIVGAASVTGTTTAPIPAIAGTYNTINNALFGALVYAYNGYVAGPEGVSLTNYDFSIPSNPAIIVQSGSNTIVGSWDAPPVSGCTYTATLYKNGGSPLVLSGITLLTCTFSDLIFAWGDQFFMTVYATSGGVGSVAQSPPIAITTSPTGVNIVTPLTQTPTTLTVNWTPPSGFVTGYVIKIYLGNTSGTPVGTYTDNTGTLTSCAVTGTYSISLANIYIATVTAYTGAFAPPSGQSGASSLAAVIFQQPINTQYTTVPDLAGRLWALAESVAWIKNFNDDITIQLASYDGGSVQQLLFGTDTTISGNSGTTGFSFMFNSGKLFYVALTVSEVLTQNVSPVQDSFKIV